MKHLLSLTILFFTLTAFSQSNPSSDEGNQSNVIDNEIIGLRTKKRMIEDILSTAEEINTLKASVTYTPNPLLDSIPSLILRVETARDTSNIVASMRSLALSLTKINKTNLDAYQALMIKLTQLKKYTQNPTELQIFRDGELQVLRTNITTSINKNYSPLAVDVPQLLPRAATGGLDVPNTVKKARVIQTLINGQVIANLRKRASREDFDILTRIYTTSIEDFKREMNAQSASIDNQISDLEKQRTANQKTAFDWKVLYTVFPLLIVFVLAILYIPYYYRNHIELFVLIFAPGVLMRLITVFLLIVVILMLGFSGKLESSALSALLGGISGYVLRDTGKAISANKKQKKKLEKIMKKAAKMAAEKEEENERETGG